MHLQRDRLDAAHQHVLAPAVVGAEERLHHQLGRGQRLVLPRRGAMPSKYLIAWNASSASWLEPSLSEPLRITTRLRGSPLDTSVRRKLEMRPRKSVHATTTSAITPAVIRLRAGRAVTLRRL